MYTPGRAANRPGAGGTIGPMEPAMRPGPRSQWVFVRRRGCGCLPALFIAALIIAVAVTVAIALTGGGDAGSGAACGLFDSSFGPGGSGLTEYELVGTLEEVRSLAAGADPAVGEAAEVLFAASQSGRTAAVISAAAAMAGACAAAGHGG